MAKVLTERELLEFEALGYITYKRRVDEGVYPVSTLQAIIRHREHILDKYNKEENKIVHRNIGMGYTNNFFVPIDFPGAFVDADDVFAAIYALDIQLDFQKYRNETYTLWMLVTNDEYMPVLPMIYIQKKKPADYFTKKKRNDFAETVKEMCHNLKYPMCSFEEFEGIIEKEQSIRGKVSKRFLLGQIYDAQNGFGLFDPQTIACELGGLSREILVERGYEII